MSALFNGDNSDSDGELKINTDYAKNYNTWRQKEELFKLKAKYGDVNDSAPSDESSGSESSSEEAEENELTKQFDKDFYKTLAYLKNKDPKIYNEEVTFFEDTKKAQELHSEKKKQKSAKEKSVFLRDYERNIILEREGKFSDSEDENELKRNKKIIKDITYVQEQNQLKESFKDAFHDEEEEDDLLKPKTKSKEEKEKEEADYKEWLKGQKKNINENEQQVLKPLRDFWSNPNLDANEKFLRDYILNNKYLDNDYTGSDLDEDERHLIHNSDENLSEDEKNIEKQEEFEHKYNFRFEEPDEEYLKRYPRTMENSLRRKDTRRSEKRAELKQRKEYEKLRKEEELKQLKALKRKEIEEKIEKLKEITGNDDIQLNDIDLDGDFDPNEHDRKMTKLFNDDYYAVSEEDIKPEFPDIDEELEIEDTWDNYDPTTENYANEEGYEGPHCEDADFNMDADYDPSKKVQEEINAPKRRKRKRMSKFAELIAKKKPTFDPQQYKSYEEYFDKYYSLDYEDIIGDTPCRFKYRKVVPNDFGLSVEEILMADDRELNKWCSLKKALQYRPDHVELNDVQMFKRKAQNKALKQKILKSLYTDPEKEEEDKEENANSVSNTENIVPKKKRQRKKKNLQEGQNVSFIANQEMSNDKEEKERRKKVKNNVEVTQEKLKESSKVEKGEKSEESANSVTESRPQKETKTANEIISKESSFEKKVKNQNHNESNYKFSKKEKSKEKITMKFRQKKRKDFKNKDVNDNVASLNPERLKTYGINVKKLKNKLKYSKKQQKS
ncbi:Protein KRI1 like protein [Habropoda laboriosa]|uniref:Protein KRI1 homolog n=1 Tax=Habropoda laboriosa TaxID=597456 RepID=A0A0L7QNA0_9HYME|nr:PREDICTED: protein KRI1 homolog [Habropoda laboriosa]KOC60044.1 Protein KRI1 like protein [Habropoda laboriosa]